MSHCHWHLWVNVVSALDDWLSIMEVYHLHVLPLLLLGHLLFIITPSRLLLIILVLLHLVSKAHWLLISTRWHWCLLHLSLIPVVLWRIFPGELLRLYSCFLIGWSFLEKTVHLLGLNFLYALVLIHVKHVIEVLHILSIVLLTSESSYLAWVASSLHFTSFLLLVESLLLPRILLLTQLWTIHLLKFMTVVLSLEKRLLLDDKAQVALYAFNGSVEFI